MYNRAIKDATTTVMSGDISEMINKNFVVGISLPIHTVHKRKEPKPRKALEERVANVITALVPNMIQESLKPIISDIKDIKSGIHAINTRLDNLVKVNNLKE
ncbi:MAG: hypothetical protein LBJ97_04790 [Mycoplasmataceae bacterium]|jgi:hypothetical protein|nr:hypothetical protein [Mycoplasmataceae bacterium]